MSAGPDYQTEGDENLYLVLTPIPDAPYTIEAGANWNMQIVDNSRNGPTAEQLKGAPSGREFSMSPVSSGGPIPPYGKGARWRNRHVTMVEGQEFTYGIYFAGLGIDETVIVKPTFVQPEDSYGRRVDRPCGDIQVIADGDEIRATGGQVYEITLKSPPGSVEGQSTRCALTHHLQSSTEWGDRRVCHTQRNKETGQNEEVCSRLPDHLNGNDWFSSYYYFHGKPWDDQLLLTITVLNDRDSVAPSGSGGAEGDVGVVKRPTQSIVTVPQPVQVTTTTLPAQANITISSIVDPATTTTTTVPEPVEITTTTLPVEQQVQVTTTTSTVPTTTSPTTTSPTTTSPTTTVATTVAPSTTTVPPTTTTTVSPTTTTVPPKTLDEAISCYATWTCSTEDLIEAKQRDTERRKQQAEQDRLEREARQREQEEKLNGATTTG